MGKRFSKMMASVLLLLLPMNVFANGEVYPLKSRYPDGIEAADTSLFSNSKVEKPIETGFEKSSEIELLINESLSNQFAVSEDSYSGKFALKIQKSDDEIIPVYETDYFQTGFATSANTKAASKSVVDNVSGIQVQVNDKNVTVSGKKAPREEVTILVTKGETICYIDQKAADENGEFIFSFTLMEYGTYKLGVGGSQSEAIFTCLELVDSATIEPEISKPTEPVVGIDTKCNFYTLKLKSMNNSETISFYVKVKKLNELGNIEEDYALIKSDSSGDGIYSVGADLSRGKWQTIQLNIADLDEKFQNGAASGLYMKANKGSQWLIDEISSDYRKTNEAEFNLAEFASGNVIFSEDELRFANYNSIYYNIGSKVISGGIKVSEQIANIQIDSRLMFASEDNKQQQEKKEILYSLPLESDNCVVNNEGEEITCEKVQKPKVREEIPTVSNTKSITIPAKPETEKRFRLKLKNNRSDKSINITIQDKLGATKTHTFSNTIYTDWYDSDITLSSTSYLNNVLESIEYEAIKENPQQDIIMNQNGSFSVNLGDFTTDDRTNLVYELSYENTSSAASVLLLEFFEGDSSEPYYITKTYINMINAKQLFNSIVPKIKANTKLKITNTITGNTPVTIRVSGIEVLKLADSDWNKTIGYVNNEITERNFNLEVNETYLKQQCAKDLYSEEDKYAVVYPDAIGVVNTGKANSTWEDDISEPQHSFSVYRILNLSKEPVKALVSTSIGTNITSGTPIFLHYGIADYVVSGGSNRLSLPPDEKVMLIGKTCYSDKNSGSSPIHYTCVDGLYDGEFIQNESSIIYSNVYDNGSAYKYDLERKTSQKLSEDSLVCASPDGTHLLLKDSDEKYYILNIATNEKEIVPLTGTYKECFFNVKNELFVINSSLNYYNTGELHTIFSGIKYDSTYSYDFDSSGEYLLWTLDRTAILYKNTNGIWNGTKSVNTDYIIQKSVLSNDISAAYTYNGINYNFIYTVDLNTQTSSSLLDGKIIDMTDDNMLMYSTSDYYYYLYNPVTAERHRMFNSSFECESITYNPATNMVTGILSNSRVIYHRFTAEEPEAKYALSFDGRDNWYAYTGGRWQTVSNRTVPTGEELRLSGMTASAVNSIPSSAYEKLYSNNTDVLTVDVAIYMYSDSQKRTPVIENIVVETVKKEDLDGLYGIHMEKYNKKDYRKIISLFPVENFGSNAECYYLLYIGNDWLYTYKNNEIVKVDESADTILSDMSESWIKFKQYGMTAKELRRISGDVLSQLFVNDNFANTEFGVIYVVKTKNESTEEYVVNFRLGASSDFITNNDVVVEIVMNGGDVKIIDSTEFSATDIENLLSWIEARQSGNGEVFYRLKNEKTQHFINYYMINSISVYNGNEYRAKTEEE